MPLACIATPSLVASDFLLNRAEDGMPSVFNRFLCAQFLVTALREHICP